MELQPTGDAREAVVEEVVKAVVEEVVEGTVKEMCHCAPTDRMPLLLIAEGYINGPRAGDYGHPKLNHARIGAFWSVKLGSCVLWNDVIEMMVLFKEGRLMHSPHHHDGHVDIAGYAGVWDKALNEPLTDDEQAEFEKLEAVSKCFL